MCVHNEKFPQIHLLTVTPSNTWLLSLSRHLLVTCKTLSHTKQLAIWWFFPKPFTSYVYIVGPIRDTADCTRITVAKVPLSKAHKVFTLFKWRLMCVRHEPFWKQSCSCILKLRTYYTKVTYTYMRLHILTWGYMIVYIRSLIVLKLSLLSSHTVRHEYSLVEQHLDSVEQLNKATCRVLSSQVAG